MNMSMSVQAEALQVLPAPVPTDYLVVIVNVISILFSVYAGYWLSEKQRKRLEKKKELDELAYALRYVLGLVFLQRNLLGGRLEAFNQTIDKLFKEKKLMKVVKLEKIDIDYREVSKLLPHYPNITVSLGLCAAALEDINYSLDELYKCDSREGDDIKLMFNEISQVLQTGIDIMEQLGSISSKVNELGQQALVQCLGGKTRDELLNKYALADFSSDAKFQEVATCSKSLLAKIDKVKIRKAPQ